MSNKWTEENNRRMLVMIEDGLSFSEIAKVFKRSYFEIGRHYISLKKKKSREEEREQIKMADGYPRILRKCHDCGALTTDYRCPKCWAKLRAKGGYVVTNVDKYDVLV